VSDMASYKCAVDCIYHLSALHTVQGLILTGRRFSCMDTPEATTDSATVSICMKSEGRELL
jgi:hypothetical protein